jgi:3-hydroxyisobutyrate dehydrogenase
VAGDAVTTLPTVAFIGLGHMGVPMVTRLAAAGYPVRGYDVAEKARAELDAIDGAQAVARLDAVAVGADVVILMLPGSSVVEDVLVTSGLLESLPAGTVLIDMGSSEPSRTKALAEQAAPLGVVMIDAPVSGGVRGATAGSLAIMVGGSEEEVAKHRAMFDVLGAQVTRVGGVGAGHAVKSLNNLMSACHLLASSEAMLAGIAFGLDPAVILEVVNGSSGRSWSTENKWPQFVLTEAFNAGFGIQLMVKDMRIALALARETATPARFSELAVDMWADAADALPATADHTAIVRWLRGEA